ncbi:MAG: MoaD/ThiS family protein [Nitrososphaerota archaeon]|nr:MoaD/ThiS family protein [Nitrososphaerota archaeon]
MSTDNVERRVAIKKIALVGAGVAAFAFGGLELLQLLGRKTTPKTVALSNTAPTSESLLTIKVAYFGMATQSTGTSVEYLNLPAPAHLQDLLSELKQRHVVLVVMLPNMQILINGIPAEGNPELQDHSEIDFIPLFAGG